jgi:RNA polymerase sigma factor (sigma-70 family)
LVIVDSPVALGAHGRRIQALQPGPLFFIQTTAGIFENLVRQHAVEAVPEPAHTDAYTPEHAASDRQARARLESMLDELDPDKRAVFVMFEIDRMSCDEIAALVGVPVGTVYSRLHGARKAFEKSLARWRARTSSYICLTIHVRSRCIHSVFELRWP